MPLNMISYHSMAMKCANCGKGVMYGHNVSHSKRRTQKIFKPNLHSSRIDTGNGFVRVKLCTKCLRTFKKATAPEPQPVEVVEAPQALA